MKTTITQRLKFPVSILITLYSLLSTASAQPFFQYSDSVPVTIGTTTLNNAWAGGLNFSQFSEIDLNHDSKKDLVVFDRSGNRVNTFINDGSAGLSKYRYAPFYSYYMPRLKSWALFRDYNKDGKEDIFTYKVGAGAMSVYKNITENDTPKFELTINILYSDYLPNMLNLYVNPVDIPTIDDIDGDGDLDICTFNILGGFMEEHVNLSMETYGTCDSLKFRLKTSCWGRFMENSTSNSVLFDTCSYLGFSQVPWDEIPPTFRHTGSTSFTLDMNNDGVKEMVLGDVSFNNFTLLNNDGTADTAHIFSQSAAFPAGTPLNLEVFPAGFYLDVDNDGAKDLLASPNVGSLGANVENNWYYKNTGQTNLPTLEFQTKSFLNGEMIEVGEGAYPVLVDLNQDNLMDLVVGNRGVKTTGTNYVGKIAMYQNIGTATQPAFKRITDNIGNIGSENLFNPYPAFADLDGDGDMDMLVGKYNGKFDFYQNASPPNSLPTFTLAQADYQNLSVGNNSFSAPQFFDVDKDGLVDLIVGEYNGNINYFRNTGTATSPVFTLQTDFFGQVKTTSNVSNLGYSTPCMYRFNGETRLFCGSEDGTIFYYDSIDGNLGGKFRFSSTNYQGIDEGGRTAMTMADLNADSLPELIVGNYAGGVVYYQGTNHDPGIPFAIAPRNSVFEKAKLYPNPANEFITISFPASVNGFSYSLLDISGREVLKGLAVTNKTDILLTNLQIGLYTLRLQLNEDIKNYKVVVNR